jgi:putative redox protein
MDTLSTPAPDAPVVVRTARGGFRTDIEAGGHRLVADEPAALGGTGAGPTPYDYLLAGLGACTGMTLRMYADHKGWPLEEVVVSMRHGRTHEVDCENCKSPASRVDRVDREIELVGPLDETQRARLLHIANQCPVHRTLATGFQVETRLAEPAAAPAPGGG